MEIAFRVITGFMVSVFAAMIVDLLLPKLKKSEAENERIAKSKKYVKLSKKFFAVFLALLSFVNIVGVLIIALPDVVTDYLRFNYTVTILVWWIPLIFSDAMGYFLFTKAMYDDEKIVVKKLFFKPKAYYYDDITDFSQSGNLRVVTSKGKFVLFNAFAGTSSLREFIKQKRT